LIQHGDIEENDAGWYAVWTRSRQEKASAKMLDTLGVEHYLPLKTEIRKWSDRRQMVEVPLFSGYLFVNMNLMTQSKLEVLKVPGIVAFVGNRTGPLPISPKQIEDIRRVLAAGTSCFVKPLFKEGDLVRVCRGALAGVEGRLVRVNSDSQLLISVDMIRQSLAVNISSEDVERVEGDCARALGLERPTAA
jgi:transcription antitermination factor NusG